MRQALAKGTRRELRRAIGSDAVDSLEKQRADVGKLAEIVHALRNDQIALTKDYALLKQRVELEHGVTMGVDSVVHAHGALLRDLVGASDRVSKSLVSRFRWLFTGR